MKMTKKFWMYLDTTPKQRKMARLIAQDVLDRMKWYNIQTGTYLNINNDNVKTYLGYDEPVQDLKPGQLKQCQVCAKGAMFLSRGKLFNVVILQDDVCNTTNKDFGQANADLIEQAFEKGNVPYESDNDDSLSLRNEAVLFGKKYDNPRKRLRAIMKNVVENKGVFRPWKETVSKKAS